jgi:hypothetical protein
MAKDIFELLGSKGFVTQIENIDTRSADADEIVLYHYLILSSATEASESVMSKITAAQANAATPESSEG